MQPIIACQVCCKSDVKFISKNKRVCWLCILERGKLRKRDRIKRPPVQTLKYEKWLPIKGYNGDYEISSHGRVKTINRQNSRGRLRQERILKTHVGKRKYEAVCLHLGGRIVTCLVHRLVAGEFLENPLNKPFVNHKNGIKTDNRIANLEWCTQSENVRHAFETGLNTFRGENHYYSKLSNSDALEISTSTLPIVELSKKYRVSASTIANIRNGVQWSHLTGIKYQKRERYLSDLEILEIKNSSLSVKELAAKYKRHVVSINRILKRKNK